MSLFFNVSPAFFAQVVLAYLVSYSLRFDGTGTNDYLNRVVTASNRTTWTWSAWVKKNDLGTRDYLFSGGAAGDLSNLFYLTWEDDANGTTRNNQLYVVWRAGSSANTYSLETSASYNDTSAWHHVVLSVDTTQSNSSDKMKIYIDGAEVSYGNDNRSDIGLNPLSVNAAGNLCMGAYAYNLTSTTSRFKGQMAEVHFIDGQALTAADFGEYNSDGVWVPKEVTDINYGNNGFYLDFKGNDSGVTLLLDGSSATTDSSSANIASNLIAASGVTARDTTTLGISHPYGSSAVDVLDFSNQTGGISHTSGSILPLLDPEDTQWTLEMWVRPESFATYDYLIAQATDGATGWNNGLEWILDWDTTNIYFVGYNGSGSNTTLLQANLSTYGITVNNWHHIAVVRDGSDTMLFLNGTKAATVTNQNAVKISGNRHLFIGTDPTDTYNFDGQMTDIRITKGVARYTDSFIPPTSALSADVSGITGSNDVVLKLNADNSLTDETGRHTPTAGSTTSYSTDVPFSSGNSHSFSFSGNQTDVITLPNSTDFEFGADDFTVEMWVKWDGTTGVKVLFNTYNGSSYSGLAIGMSNGVLGVWVDTTGGANWEIDNASGGLSFTANKWHHLAVVRRGYTFDAFLDGVKGTTLGTISGSIYAQGTHDAHIGGGTALYAFNGLIDDVRITKAALYPFHPPISALTNTPEYLGDFGVDRTTDGTGVTLLLDGSSTTNDVANSQVFETVTNVTDESTGGPNSNGPVLDFGSSLVTGHLLDNDPTSLPEGTEDFTVEFWFRQDYVTNSAARSLFVGINGIAQRQVDIFLDATNKVNYYHTSSTKIAGTTTIGYQQWYHIAAVRKAGTTTLFVDGVSQGSFADTGSYTAGTKLALGGYYDGTSWVTGSNSLQGQMADVRVTRGVARYTDSFTPPISALTNTIPSGTVKMRLNGTTVDDQSPAGLNDATLQGTASANDTTVADPYGGSTGSYALDGSVSGNYLNTPSIAFGTDDFTIETWVYFDSLTPDASNNYQTLFSQGYSSAGGISMQTWDGDGTFILYLGSAVAQITSSIACSAGGWHHIAITRRGDVFSLFIDGVNAGSVTNSININNTSNFEIGNTSTATQYGIDGYIKDFRVTTGSVLYPFHPPTSALTNDDTWDKPKNDFLVEGNITPDDQLLDTPNLRFASFDPSNKGANVTLSEANFNSVSSSGYSSVITTETIPTGSKIYVEWTCDNSGALNFIGIAPSLPTGYVGDASTGWGLYMPLASGNLEIWNNGQLATTLTASSGPAGPHVAMMAVDRVNNAIHFGYNGLWRTTTTATTTLPSTAPVTGIDSNSTYYIVASSSPSRSVITNLGQDHTFAGQKSALLTPYSDANGVGEFYYQPPSGFLALATEYK